MSDETTDDERLAEMVLRQGEINLQAQLQIALAADQRASTFAGIYTAISVAALAASAAVFQANASAVGLIAAGLAVAVVSLIAANLCLGVAQPTNFHIAGNRPDNWWSDGARDRALAECLERESHNYDRYIGHNDEILARNASRLRRALRVGLMVPVAGSVVFLMVQALVRV